MYELIKVLAKMHLYSGENMRQSYFTSGYRPLFKFDAVPMRISGKVDLITEDSFYPGSFGTVQISFIKGIISEESFRKGALFSFSEGRNSIGEGEIIEILK